MKKTAIRVSPKALDGICRNKNASSVNSVWNINAEITMNPTVAIAGKKFSLIEGRSFVSLNSPTRMLRVIKVVMYAVNRMNNTKETARPIRE